MTKAPEREYLRLVLRRQPLWKVESFWQFYYNADIQHKLDNPSLPSTPLSCSRGVVAQSTAQSPTDSAVGDRGAPVPSAAEVQAHRDEVVFELACGCIYLQLSLGAGVESVRRVVAATASTFQLRDDKQRTLQQLVDNIARSTQASTAAAETYTPQPRNQRPLGLLHAQGSRSQHTPHTPNSHTLQFPANDDD
jgi:hypothetical protein